MKNDLKLLHLDEPRMSEDIKEAFVRYLLLGLRPGGFCEAMLAGDLWRACSVADTANRLYIANIGNWIQHWAPAGSWGDYQAVDGWCNNRNGIRGEFLAQHEQARVYQILTTPEAKN